MKKPKYVLRAECIARLNYDYALLTQTTDPKARKRIKDRIYRNEIRRSQLS